MLLRAAKRRQGSSPGREGLVPNVRTAAPLLSRGGVAARQRKSCEATLARADGVVLIKKMILLTSTTPAAATASAFPPRLRRGVLGNSPVALARQTTPPHADTSTTMLRPPTEQMCELKGGSVPASAIS